MTKLATMTSVCPDWTLDELVAGMKRHGYEGVEPRVEWGHKSAIEMDLTPTARAEVRRRFADEGLSICCLASGVRMATPDAAEWRFTYDRRWHVTTDRAELAVLRLLVRGELLAQCNASPLEKRPPEKLITLAQFQQDVKQALGESFGEFVRASEDVNESEYRVYRVVARGAVDELPIQWHYYMVADREGRQVAFAFTIEQALLTQFGKADEALIDTLRFTPPKEQP